MQCCFFSFVSIYTYSVRSNSAKLLFHKLYKHLAIIIHALYMDTMECSTLMGERFVCGFAHRGNVLQAINASDQTHEPAQTVEHLKGLVFLENGKKTRMAISFYYVYTKYID